MKITKMLGVTLFFLAWMVIFPVSQAYAYFAEDSFVSLWSQAGPQIPEPVRQPSGAEATHQVAPGETLWSLARYYHVELARLMSINRISDPARLSVGRVLIIPGGQAQAAGAGQQPAAVYAVARGWNSNLSWPLLGELTQEFGPQENGEFHHGLDIAGNTGMPIRAAQRGLVVSSGWLPVYGYTVVIDHGSGFRTLYAHVHDFVARAGSMVDKGQVIAHVGATGNATGPHLHFELRHSNQAVNPLPYLGN